MGEYGMSYGEARRTPERELLALWKARERRMARSELRLLEDMFAVSGLQSEVKVEGEPKKKGKRVTPVTLNKRREQLRDEGYPKRRVYDPERDRKRIEAFWASADLEGAKEVDLTGNDERDGAGGRE